MSLSLVRWELRGVSSFDEPGPEFIPVSLRFNSAERNEVNPDKKCGALCANSPEIESKPVLFALLKGNQEVEISIEKGGEDDASPKIGVEVGTPGFTVQ